MHLEVHVHIYVYTLHMYIHCFLLCWAVYYVCNPDLSFPFISSPTFSPAQGCTPSPQDIIFVVSNPELAVSTLCPSAPAHSQTCKLAAPSVILTGAHSGWEATLQTWECSCAPLPHSPRPSPAEPTSSEALKPTPVDPPPLPMLRPLGLKDEAGSALRPLVLSLLSPYCLPCSHLAFFSVQMISLQMKDVCIHSNR